MYFDFGVYLIESETYERAPRESFIKATLNFKFIVKFALIGHSIGNLLVKVRLRAS